MNRNSEKGVCRNTLVPVRKEPVDTSEMVSQLIFGDHYEVSEWSNDKKWARIRIYFDGYYGWISASQHHRISEEYFEQINHSDYKISLDVVSSILYNKSPLHIVMGSILPITTNELFRSEEQFAFNGEAKSQSQKREFDYLKNIAHKYINAPYQWGGKSPFGIDCSGFIQMVFKICGYKLPRDSREQSQQGEEIDNFNQKKGGDLVFFTNNNNTINHVGIVLEEERIIHASGKVRIDKLQEDGIVNLESGEKTHKLAKIKRIIRNL